MSENKWAELRKPFPKESVGKLPKGGRMLDYVGHAAVTDRLLAVDPEWTWEPMATDERGLPVLDGKSNLWIRLTVLGVTRIGVGDGPTAKECIGDAIRNAAMRFGVALTLWSKEELESVHSTPQEPPRDFSGPVQVAVPTPPLAVAKARAWNAAKALWTADTDDERKASTEAALAGMGSSIADADTATWNTLAEVWEAALRKATKGQA